MHEKPWRYSQFLSPICSPLRHFYLLKKASLSANIPLLPKIINIKSKFDMAAHLTLPCAKTFTLATLQAFLIVLYQEQPFIPIDAEINTTFNLSSFSTVSDLINYV